jgi:hypothetical protein
VANLRPPVICYCANFFSAVKLCVLLNEVDCFCSLWNEIFFQLFYLFCASENGCSLLRINSEPFDAFRGHFYFIIKGLSVSIICMYSVKLAQFSVVLTLLEL